MIGWLLRKLFLLKEIRSKDDVLHFQRFRLLTLPWFRVFLHRILESDRDRHMHDHPFNFISFILWGSYTEQCAVSPNWSTPKSRRVGPGSIVRHGYSDAHKLTLNSRSVWTIVFAGQEKYDWGYQTEQGWIDHDLYRQRKRAGYI